MRDTHILTPIGTIENEAKAVEEVPSEGLPSLVVVDDEYFPAIRGIEVGDHVYVLAIFDQADPSQLSGSTGTPQEQGAFSIRSSSRPNRIGMTLARVTAIDGPRLSFDWLDFSDGTPVVDLKRYNWRWECILSARRLDRRFIERQIDRVSLVEVLTRPAVNFHGERCAWVERMAELSARLVQEFDLWISDPQTRYLVTGNGHLVDAVQGMTGATLGNGRLELHLDETGSPVIQLSGGFDLRCRWEGHEWTVESQTAGIQRL